MRAGTGRSRSIGLAGGALWLTAVSAVFVIWSLLMIGTPLADGVLIGALVVTGAVIAASVVVIRAARRLPKRVSPRTPEEKATGRRFGWVVVAEVAAFMVVNPVAAVTGHVELIPSLDLAIVGLHFLPLAWLFHVPRYYVMGVLFCAIPAATVVSMPANAAVGYTLGWYVVPSLGCGLVAMVTAAAGVREAWRDVRGAWSSSSSSFASSGPTRVAAPALPLPHSARTGR
jgi:hypothetical protein